MAPDGHSQSTDGFRGQERALARWDNEGGAGPGGAGGVREAAKASRTRQSAAPPLTNAEVVQLQVRVIALENLLIALLAHASERQLDAVREMAAFISPRPGFTPHRLTIHAAAEMISLVDRACIFRVTPPAGASNL